MQDFKEVISNVTKDLELNPRDAKLYADRAKCYFMIGQYDKAIADYDKAIEMHPSFAEAYYCKARILATLAKIHD